MPGRESSDDAAKRNPNMDQKTSLQESRGKSSRYRSAKKEKTAYRTYIQLHYNTSSLSLTRLAPMREKEAKKSDGATQVYIYESVC